MKVIEQFFVVADCRKVALILGVLKRDFLFSEPVPVDGADQLLIFLGQPLLELLYFLVVHRSFLFPQGFMTSPQKTYWSLTQQLRFLLKPRVREREIITSF